ncbi:hypothetical protein [Sphingomonas jaspsi]|uniref:hypothetical protein n=1 Tax=Sphingomonas jaspsi TaxID=392409 RepID=UPI0004BC7989|nr:hypothetical protein [Sphingomonas jaspsi]
MSPDASQIFASPDYHCLGMGQDRAQFVRMDRDDYRQSLFLDRRLVTKRPEILELPLAPLIGVSSGAATGSPRWIFHVAHCGSTLLANLLDQPGRSLVLREPPALRQVGIARGQGMAVDAVERRFGLAHRLSSRTFDPAETVVIKANVPVNFCLDLVAKVQPNSPAVLLYLDWPDYLTAILRTDNHRSWLTNITSTFRAMIESILGAPLSDVDAERAASLWLAQMQLYRGFMDANPAAAALDAELLFQDPLATAAAVASHLGLHGVDPTTNAAALGSYSKNPSQPFDSETRRRRAEADRERLSGELAVAGAWLARITAQDGLPKFDRSITP